jgi:hypothetical protein
MVVGTQGIGRIVHGERLRLNLDGSIERMEEIAAGRAAA